MIKIAYYYNGNKKYIDKLKDNNLVLLIDDEKYVDELIGYNLPIRIVKNDTNYYDILVSETDNVKNIMATRKFVIGNYETKKPKITYMEKFDKDKIFEQIQTERYKFSIIVPNYNNGDWISRTIESVINQTYENWEMYVIDDMSTDNSVEIINKYKEKRIHLIENKIKLYNGGSRNVGILKAKESNPTGYLLFIDSDDWLANNKVLETLNSFIEDEDLITLDYEYYMNGKIKPAGKCSYKNKDDLFMTIGCMCAVWCKCFKVSIAPLFEFNTLMEDRNYHYRLINKIETYANLGQVTHTWNKDNQKSVTTNKKQKYDSHLQTKIEWNNCAYRHIAGMLDLLNELTEPKYITYIKEKIEKCKRDVNTGIYQQY